MAQPSKYVGALVLLLIIVATGYAGYYGWQRYRGALPVLLPPGGDIAKMIDDANVLRDTAGIPLKLPVGFHVNIFARDLGHPRVLLQHPGGGLLFSNTEDSKVELVRDANSDGKAEERNIILQGLNKPHGLAILCADEKHCTLYVAEVNAISSYDYDPAIHAATNRKKIADLPDGGRHTTRTLLLDQTPQGDKLYVSIGSSCDVCHEEDTRRASVQVIDLKTNQIQEFARGLRNAVFMTQSLVSGEIWATEMGRDQLGDARPPDEINILREGKNYGWPVCFGDNIHDDAFDKNTYIRNPCTAPFEEPSYVDLPAHVAPLGLAFVPEEGWPEQYWYNLIVAEHGSWNSATPVGYKLERIMLDAKGTMLGQEDFIVGWLDKDGRALGRPVDVLTQPGGIMYISDDKAGVIYRVTYKEDSSAQGPDGSTDDRIHVDAPKENDQVQSPLVVTGQARGNWYFEASFPVKLLDSNGNMLAQTPAQAQGDWMTEDFVPFIATLGFTLPEDVSEGTLILEKDNPSGLLEHAAQIQIPVRFAQEATRANDCIVGGCSGEVCADIQMASPCLYTAKFACYKQAVCERQSNGQCGWTETPAFKICVANLPSLNNI